MGELNGRTLRDITTQPLAQTDSVVPGPVPNLTQNHADATTEPSVKRWRSPKVSPMRAQPEDGDWIGGPQRFALVNDPAFLHLQPLGKVRRG
jgi:hypothetical protein